ncbi:MAG: diguanylate cyclase [Rhodocyclaceae bacterium]|nr:MAG: diguanylate cyclase [Rhodocyclaceae bacterium]
MVTPHDDGKPYRPGLEKITASQVVNLNPIATFVINANHVVTHWNLACERLTGYKAEDILGTRNQWQPFYCQERPVMADIVLDGSLENDVDRFYPGKYRRSKHMEGAFEVEDFFPNFGPHGRWLYFTAALLRNEAGEVIGAIETLQDITARRRAEEALKQEKALLDAIINGSSVATIVIDDRHTVTHVNRAYEVLVGVAREKVVGTDKQWHPAYTEPRPVLADLLLNGASDAEFALHYGEHFRPSQLIPGAMEAERFFPRLGENGRWLYLTAAPMRDETGFMLGVIETLQDTSERKLAELALQASEERYRQLSATDGLTALGNLRSCYEQLEKEIARSNRYKSPLSVLLFDVDNFKHYNDTWGHMEGDSALIALSTCILNNLRKTDGAYRYGGEEFVVILPETALDQAVILAERIRMDYASKLLHPVPNITTACTVSIGAAELETEDTARALLQRADSGTYLAKERGKNRVVAV